MEKDYRTSGSRALEKLRASAENAEEVQNALLDAILRQNEDTAYGRRYGFSEIHSMKEYQQKVPLSTYEDYEPYVERLFQGYKKQLTSQEPIYYCISSGSIGEPKYEPLTEEDILVHYEYAYQAIFGMVQEYYPELRQEELFGKIFQVGEFASTFGKNGVMNGIRSSSLYQWLDRDGAFDASNYCVPKEILFPKKIEDLTYIQARFALAEREITAVHGVFVYRMAEMLRYIEEHWELLLNDMETGEVSPQIALDQEWIDQIKKWLPPNEERARELRAISRENLSEGMLLKLWKKVRYVLCIGGGNFSTHTQIVENYAKGVPIHYFVYAATEGIFGVAYELDHQDSYVLIPEAGVFEFLPIGVGTEMVPLSMNEVRIGEKYELIFTNLSGLYRYRMMDVLEVIGFYRNAPVIRFCYRLNQILNIADEKMNMEQMELAMESFREKSGLTFRDYCVQEDYRVSPGRYLIYIESVPCEGDASKLLEECLQRSSVGYLGCRRINKISPVKVHFVPDGSFASYDASFSPKEVDMGQIKPLRLLNTEARKDFFAKLIERMGER